MYFTEHATHVIAHAAESFYRGTMSSVEAFDSIDRALLSWPHPTGWMIASRELFDAFIDALIDFDVDSWAKS